MDLSPPECYPQTDPALVYAPVVESFRGDQLQCPDHLPLADGASMSTDDVSHAVEYLRERLQSGTQRHLVFVVGSVVSIAPPSCCPGVGTIREQLVLRPMLALQEKNLAHHDLLAQFLDQSLSPLGKVLSNLPFEQFMQCLYMTDREAALGIVEIAFGLRHHQRPNHNHKAVVSISKGLLDADLADTVTILTTNYDTCLEPAMKEVGFALEPWDIENSRIPAFQAKHSAHRAVRLVKLHGCINRPDTLVFTFGQMTRSVVETDHVTSLARRVLQDVAQPKLCIFLGYGLNDPDLRPFFQELLRNIQVVLYNDKPKADSLKEQSLLSKATPANLPTGQEVLRAEFLAVMLGYGEIKETQSDLVQGGNDLIFALAQRLFPARPLSEPSPSSSADADTAMTREARVTLAARMGPSKTTLFLARLAEACCRPEAAGVLAEAAQRQSASKPWPEMLRYYLLQFPTVARYHEAVLACRWAHRKWRDDDSRTVALASELLALTLGDSERLVNAVYRKPTRLVRRSAFLQQFWVLQRALGVIARARTCLGGCTPPVRRMYRHYSLHFWAKLVEYLDQRSAVSALGRRLDLLRPFLRCWARALAKSLEKLHQKAMDESDLTLVGDTQAVRAEMLLVSGSHEEGLAVAKTVRLYRSIVGMGNNAALGDRLLGWAYNGAGARNEAIRAFARGLWRATYSTDTSLRLKLAVELARAMDIEGDTITPNPVPQAQVIESIRKTCLELCRPRPGVQPAPPLDDRGKEGAAIRAFLGYLYQDPKALVELRKTLHAYRDTRRFPMLLIRHAPISSGPSPKW